MGVVVVTGTNGKTTTARFLADVLTAQGISFVHNRDGSNLPRGIVSTLAISASPGGRINAQVGLFEVDEGWLGQIASALPPRVVVVTGLARDQLDRYGEVDIIIERFREILRSIPVDVCLNADDPLAAGLADSCKGAVRFFGASGYPFAPLEGDTAIDAVTSPLSGAALRYRRRYFGHVGIYESLDGEFSRPAPDVDAFSVESCDLDGSVFDVSIAGVVRRCRIRVGGMFNVYNALAAITAGTALGIPTDVLFAAVEGTVPAFGRL